MTVNNKRKTCLTIIACPVVRVREIRLGPMENLKLDKLMVLTSHHTPVQEARAMFTGSATPLVHALYVGGFQGIEK